MPCPDADSIAGFLDGKLDAAGAGAIETHLDDCATCRVVIVELARTFGAGAGASERGAEEPTPFVVGQRVGRYVVLDWLGAGAMGIVYGAYDTELDRKVALKLVAPDVSHAATDETRRRLVREAKALARVNHPNVVHVFDVGECEGQIFVAMEFVDAGTLAEWLAERPRSWREVLDVCIAAGRGLAAAHAKGLVHRDFKSANVLVGTDGRARVSDFGLARPAQSDPVAADRPRGATDTVTAPGVHAGTPAYMAPEQLRGVATAASDQFAFCVTAYEALYGERPWTDNAPVSSRTPKEAASSSGVPRWVRAVLLRGLEADPERRHASMDALLAALSRDPRTAWLRAFAVSAIAAVAVVSGFAYARATRQEHRLCAGAEQTLGTAWNADKKHRVEAAFHESGLPYAATAWKAVEGALDAQAARWIAMRTDTCEATQLRGEQSQEALDLRMACLDERLKELRALSDILTRADANVVERSVDAASSLPSLEVCRNVDQLRSKVRPPTDPQAAAQLDRLRDDLATVKAMRETGKYKEALARVKAMLGDPAIGAYAPLHASALLLAGDLDGFTGNPEAAMRELADAARVAEQARDDPTKAAALVLLAVAHSFRGAFTEAHRVADFAAASVERAGNDPTLLAQLGIAYGYLHLEEGNVAAARDDFHRAVGFRRVAVGDDNVATARTLAYEANATNLYGDHAQALALFTEALAILESKLGRLHPNVLDAKGGRAQTLVELRRYDEAAALARDVLAGGTPDPSTNARAEIALGRALSGKGAHADGLAHLQTALALVEAESGATHVRVAEVRVEIAHVLLREGAAKASREEAVLAFRIWENQEGKPHADRALALEAVGAADLALGNPRKAIAPLSQAVELRAGATGDASELAEMELALARAMWDGGGDRARAREAATRARDRYARLPYAAADAAEASAWLEAHRAP